MRLIYSINFTEITGLEETVIVTAIDFTQAFELVNISLMNNTVCCRGYYNQSQF